MMNFGYSTDDFVDNVKLFSSGGDDYDLISIEGFSDSYQRAESDVEVADFDERGEFLMEDIMKGYEIYNMA